MTMKILLLVSFLISPAIGCFGGGGCCCPPAQPQCGCPTICQQPNYAAAPSYSYQQQSYVVAPQAVAPAPVYSAYSYPAAQQTYVSYQNPSYAVPRAVAPVIQAPQVAAVVEPEPSTYEQPPLNSKISHTSLSAIEETIQPNSEDITTNIEIETIPPAVVEQNENTNGVQPHGVSEPTETKTEVRSEVATDVQTENPVSVVAVDGESSLSQDAETYQIEVAPPPVQEETTADGEGNTYRRVRFLRTALKRLYRN